VVRRTRSCDLRKAMISVWIWRFKVRRVQRGDAGAGVDVEVGVWVRR
jgi:hypothetical protein